MIKGANKIENKILKYDSLEYLTQKIRFNDYIANKSDIVHEQLYVSALNKCIEKLVSKSGLSKDEYMNTHIFIEIKNTEYWMPSKVCIKQTVSPFKVEKIDLKEYWDDYQYVDEHKKFDSIFVEGIEDINGLEVIDINYISGKAKFRNKYTGVEFWKDFKYLNEDTVYNDDYKSLKNTFTYKLQNKIYGE